jgi:formamidopyrimidine-DNA glycosylase
LLNQAVIAGLGNLLVDEICWQARLNPSLPVVDLGDDDQQALHSAMRRVLRTAVRYGQVPARRGWLTGVRDRNDPSCPRCATRLAIGQVGGRTSLWCPRCQPRA